MKFMSCQRLHPECGSLSQLLLISSELLACVIYTRCYNTTQKLSKDECAITFLSNLKQQVEMLKKILMFIK